jgi:Protein of unknown function (DUF4013)
MKKDKKVGKSLEYAVDAVWGKWVKWMFLIFSMVIFPLLFGYLLDIMRGKNPAPDVKNWYSLFVDGLKFLVLAVIYLIPVIIVSLPFFLPLVHTLTTHSPYSLSAALRAAAGGILVAVILAFILDLFAIIGVIRFARTGSMGEAFNFRAILDYIGRIGWIRYMYSLIVVLVAVLVMFGILSLIPYMYNILIILILAPVIYIFWARYLTLVYDLGGEQAAHAAAPAASGPTIP